MKTNSDFRDLLHDWNAAGVRYLIVGGYAVMLHTEPRYRKDLDLWIEPVESNAQKLFVALAQFGAPTGDVRPSDFTEPEIFFQIGVEPVRIDIMTSVSGLDFVPAWERRMMVDFGGESAPVLCRADVLKPKVAAGRIRDRRERIEAAPTTRPLSACLESADSPEGRQRVADLLDSGPFPHYESHPDHLGLLVRIDADGNRTVGRFVNRQFEPSFGVVSFDLQ